MWDYDEQKERSGQEMLFDKVMGRSETRHVAYWLVKKVKDLNLP
jgi:hypothetical protein